MLAGLQAPCPVTLQGEVLLQSAVKGLAHCKYF